MADWEGRVVAVHYCSQVTKSGWNLCFYVVVFLSDGFGNAVVVDLKK